VAADARLGAAAVARLQPGAAVAHRTTPGGAGPTPLTAQVRAVRALLANEEQWLAG